MMFSRFKSLTVIALAASALVLPGPLAAQTPDHPTDSSATFPTREDLRDMTVAGSYLAARHASIERDATAAAEFYRSALRKDPKNNELLDRAFISSLADGNIDEAVKLAGRVLKIDKSNRVARLVIGVHDLKQKRYEAARRNINQSVRGPITDLVATLLAGWAEFGAGNARGAVADIDKLTGPEWYPVFKDLHSGLIMQLAGNEKDAGVRLERAYKLDETALRVMDAYARWLSRSKDGAPAAEAVYEAFNKKLARHPLVVEGIRETKAGAKLPPLVDTPQAGAAEALYGIGASLTRRGGEDLALVYLQLALYLQPNHALALLSLGDLYESVKKPQMAIKVYERVPERSALHRNAQVQMATDLDAADRGDEAIKILQAVTQDDPKDVEAIMALGNIERGRKKFADCAVTYSKAIDQLTGAENNNWVYYYFRGICEERSKNWDKAELDMKKALELKPEQPHVLNYLGYSWIDRGLHLDEAMKMIKRAVDQRPDDGYIVDSLGWAYYRIGNYQEAVKNLERAIDLKPEDPTINDHLGDAYWRVGRTLEARFQWAHARDLKPEPEELPKIEAKIENGLPADETPAAASADKKKDEGKGG